MRQLYKRTIQAFVNYKYIILITSTLFLLISGAAFILVYKNAKSMSKATNDCFNRQQLEIARLTANQISNILSDMQYELDNLKRMEQESENSISHEAMKKFVNYFQSRGLTDIGILNTVKKSLEYYSNITGKALNTTDKLPRDKFEYADSVKLRQLNIVTDENKTSYVTGIIYANVSPSRILYTRLNITHLIKTVTQNITSGKTGYIWVINETGNFLYHPEEVLTGKNAFSARDDKKPKINFYGGNSTTKVKMMQGGEDSGIYMSSRHLGVEGEIEKLIAFSPVDISKLSLEQIWTLAVVAPVDEVIQPVITVYKWHFIFEILLLTGLFIFGALAVVYHQQMSRSLKERVKRTEANLFQTEQVYQKIVDRATDLIYMFDLERRVILLNKHSLDVFSHLFVDQTSFDITKVDSVIYRKIDDLFNKSDSEFVNDKIDLVLKSQSSNSYRHKLKIEDRNIYLSTKLIPIHDDNGQIYQILGISRDVTERMELDNRIYNMEKLASIGTLAAGVAHEINNPLAVILGFTDLLIEKFPADTSEYKDLQIIAEQGKNAKEVVENLLGFARVSEGLEDVVDINFCLDKVINVVNNNLLTKKIDLLNEALPGLPDVRCDAREFQQVIFNLINNSIAAMEESGGKLTISAKVENNMVKIIVTDTGKGIPDNIKQHIFDPFYTTKKVGEGTGLGLSLCYGIVKKYKGNITFSSISKEDDPDLNSGSSFAVLLPVVK